MCLVLSKSSMKWKSYRCWMVLACFTTSKPSKCSTPCQQASQIVSYIWVPPHPKQDMTKLNREGVIKCKLPPARSLISFFTPPQKKLSIWRTSQGSKLHFWDPPPPPQKCNLHSGSPPQKKNHVKGVGIFQYIPV